MTPDACTLGAVVGAVLASALTAAAPWRLVGGEARLDRVTGCSGGRRGSSGSAAGARAGPADAVGRRRRGRRAAGGRAHEDRIDVLAVLALLDAALGSGASVTRSLTGVGEALGEDDGRALRTVGAALTFGSVWEAAWAGLPPHLAPVRDCLHDSWVTGSAAGPIIRAAAAQVRRRRRREAREASARLAVRLVLPLGLCFLPACLLLGLVPIVLSFAGDLW